MKFFKLNKDDILKIIIDYLAEKNGYNIFRAKAIILQDKNEMRAIVGIDKIDGDIIIDEQLLLKMDSSMDFNGGHNNNGLTDEELSQVLDRMIKTGDF